MFEIGDTYKRRYKMRAVGENGKNIVVSMPKAVIQKEADKRGLNVDDFMENFQVVAQYNSFEGVLYTFEKITKTELPQEEVSATETQV